MSQKQSGQAYLLLSKELRPCQHCGRHFFLFFKEIKDACYLKMTCMECYQKGVYGPLLKDEKQWIMNLMKMFPCKDSAFIHFIIHSGSVTAYNHEKEMLYNGVIDVPKGNSEGQLIVKTNTHCVLEGG